ncbi:energy-coupling factor transporter transmembrane component T family protein [Anaerotalea alkaliphila]|uniref:Energy-coupling factor transporter transmembrane protein EcfT n=1 Tax=Anaerotalea alkaliphila TaxID=2662126 RepID=A0A7X5HWY0_9FIRM|nr:energy-coupling factor transporter transmembrane component T [Anaerotalea alkaliphila]NDL68145.1 energy-coupling factor transporter transmembrane protein EcfT [Anaerotalea alkaliphila]
MIRDITLGQYYPAESFLHSMDPRSKIVLTFTFILSLFLAKGAPGYGVAFLFLVLAIRASKVPPRFMLKGLKAVFMIILLTVFINLFLTPGGAVLFQWGVFKVTRTGLETAVFMALRLIFLIVGSSILTLTTSPISLTDGIEALLKPWEKVKVPAHEIAMMMTIALRFIPILLEETDKIMKAQMARGADFESGGLVKKAQSLIPLLVPLFISSFRRADDLALAMEARCYRGGEGRTRMKRLSYTRVDVAAALVVAAYLLALGLLARWL